VTTGDMLAMAQSPGFKPSRSAFFMPSGSGPCRFGQYNVAQRLVLDQAGLPEVPIYSPMQDVQLYEDLGLVGGDFPRRSWLGVIAFDLLTKCLHETRPSALDPQAAEELHGHHLERLREVLAGPESGLVPALRKIRGDFEGLARSRKQRPLVGIVGEIFVRSNRFSNERMAFQNPPRSKNVLRPINSSNPPERERSIQSEIASMGS